ncbi:hypothetical protein PHJA_000470600 [Phtheirospermum japonicum]|uniref:Uncharacterized protein n=1 Tax=Phtheirospermum japonicum TaxID=374723 RepID=A0A830BB44_9LAMI|nr:hypothetical protein PHJA_000470600 [Phtheirospermum japonicum]
MGGQNKDPAVIGSSIVLLQERFKQLQRSKEMRQERQQLLKLSYQSSHGYDEPVKLSTSSDAAFQDPLALGLNSNVAHRMPHFRAIKPIHQFPSASRGAHSNFIEKPDVVDTSLRL